MSSHKQVFFITGTDTNIGKTHVACHLLRQYSSRGLKTLGLKPVSAGCEETNMGWANADAVALHHASSVKLPLEQINPIAFDEFIAPHTAAEQQGVHLSIKHVLEQCRPALEAECDVLLIEGAGGWRVPLNDTESFSDLAKAFNCPIILVSGIRLGCINHTLLTYEAIKNDHIPLHGWIANHLTTATNINKANITTIAQRIGTPPMEIIPHDNP